MTTRHAHLLLFLCLLLAGCAGTRLEPSFATFSQRDPQGGEVLGSQGNVLPTADKQRFPGTDEDKYELNLACRLVPEGDPQAFFLVTYRGHGWVYLAEGTSALSILADGTLYRFTGMNADYRKIRGRRVFESATYPVRGRDLHAILTSQDTTVRITHRNGRLEVPLTSENREHLRRFLAHEVEPRTQVTTAAR